MGKSNNMKQTFFLPKYYNIEIDTETGEVKIYSNSKHAKGRELLQHINSSGYLSVKLNNRNVPIHYLVTKFMIGEREKGLVVNHKDGNKFNNKVENLEYVTIRENILHSVRTGLHVCNRPEELGRYIDGRCRDQVKYKHDWYIKNKQQILQRVKKNYNDKKQRLKNQAETSLL